jgi:hypothetical protein
MASISLRGMGSDENVRDLTLNSITNLKKL